MLEFDKAKEIFEGIGNALRLSEDEGAYSLYSSLVESAITYAGIRVQWKLSSLEERRQMDARRTAAHNTFIDRCNALSRRMASLGLETDWRATLGTDRKYIGDFACYLPCLLGLAAR